MLRRAAKVPDNSTDDNVDKGIQWTEGSILPLTVENLKPRSDCWFLVPCFIHIDATIYIVSILTHRINILSSISEQGSTVQGSCLQEILPS